MNLLINSKKGALASENLMEVKITLNRRFLFEVVTVLELLLLIIFGYKLNVVTKQLAKAGPIAPVAAGNNQPLPPAQAQPPVGKVKPISDSDYVKGDKNAPISLIEYSDYECPFCQRFHPSVQKLLEDYKGKVKFVYRHYPLSFHANAQKEAEAAECVGSLAGAEKFHKFTDEIFARTESNGTGFALADLPKLAAELGVNQKKFEDCLNSGKFAEKVQNDLVEGSEVGVGGTPASFIVNDKTGEQKFVEGAQPYSVLKKAVDDLLKS